MAGKARASRGAFSEAFTSGPKDGGSVSWYLVLLNLQRDAADAVRVVARCLAGATESADEVRRLLLSPEGWRPQLVGCVAVLAADPAQRPMDALIEAVSRPSWVAPQLLVTTSLTAPSSWEEPVSSAIVERGDAKAAAALVAITDDPSSALMALAHSDSESGAAIAISWRNAIASAFDEAGVTRAWLDGTQAVKTWGWETSKQAWAQAQATVEQLGATQEDLYAAGWRYMHEQWPEGNPLSEADLIDAVTVVVRLNMFRGYLEAAAEARVSGDVPGAEVARDYGPLHPHRWGYWRTYSQGGQLLGALWLAKDLRSAGFFQGHSDHPAGTHAAGTAMRKLLRIMKSQSVPALVAYLAMQHTPGSVLGEEQAGQLEGAIQSARTTNDEPSTPAVDAEREPPSEVSIHVWFDPDTKGFLEVVRSDYTGLRIYDSGGWYELADDDLENKEEITVEDDGFNLVAKMLAAGQTPSLEDVLPYRARY